ncbi:hypothetical protein WA026_001710 [Henosepilachna vigintioctopunctata]|uniref:L-lactate dehydrogenase n=1 Tax=Henosepilachna vigintioctopunctata TaxID=420089 RepID=A0AAW1UKG3_9CUCU
MSLLGKMFYKEQPHVQNLSHKVSIIGAGNVGMAVAVSLLGKHVTNNLVLIDPIGDKVKGEIIDLQHGSLFLRNALIGGGNTFEDSADSKLCIITTGVRQEPGESRLVMAQRNSEIIVKVVKMLIKYSPDTMILVVGNPCDVMAYVAWKASGLPAYKVMGAGTTLDSQRFRVELSKKFNINPSNIHAWIIGEHGEHSFAIWSSVNIGGTRIEKINPKFGTDDDTEKWSVLLKDVLGAAKTIRELKDYTNWGIGMSIATIAKALMTQGGSIYAVSVNAKGKFGIEDDIFISLPAVLGSNGITDIVHLNLTEDELARLHNAAKILKEVQDSIKIEEKEVKCKCRRCK